jgi:hypothetical protein
MTGAGAALLEEQFYPFLSHDKIQRREERLRIARHD